MSSPNPEIGNPVPERFCPLAISMWSMYWNIMIMYTFLASYVLCNCKIMLRGHHCIKKQTILWSHFRPSQLMAHKANGSLAAGSILCYFFYPFPHLISVQSMLVTYPGPWNYDNENSPCPEGYISLNPAIFIITAFLFTWHTNEKYLIFLILWDQRISYQPNPHKNAGQFPTRREASLSPKRKY